MADRRRQEEVTEGYIVQWNRLRKDMEHPDDSILPYIDREQARKANRWLIIGIVAALIESVIAGVLGISAFNLRAAIAFVAGVVITLVLIDVAKAWWNGRDHDDLPKFSLERSKPIVVWLSSLALVILGIVIVSRWWSIITIVFTPAMALLSVLITLLAAGCFHISDLYSRSNIVARLYDQSRAVVDVLDRLITVTNEVLENVSAEDVVASEWKPEISKEMSNGSPQEVIGTKSRGPGRQISLFVALLVISGPTVSRAQSSIHEECYFTEYREYWDGTGSPDLLGHVIRSLQSTPEFDLMCGVAAMSVQKWGTSVAVARPPQHSYVLPRISKENCTGEAEIFGPAHNRCLEKRTAALNAGLRSLYEQIISARDSLAIEHSAARQTCLFELLKRIATSHEGTLNLVVTDAVQEGCGAWPTTTSVIGFRGSLVVVLLPTRTDSIAVIDQLRVRAERIQKLIPHALIIYPFDIDPHGLWFNEAWRTIIERKTVDVQRAKL